MAKKKRKQPQPKQSSMPWLFPALVGGFLLAVVVLLAAGGGWLAGRSSAVPPEIVATASSPPAQILVVTATPTATSEQSAVVATPGAAEEQKPVATENIPDRWLTARPEATIPLHFKPEGTPNPAPTLVMAIVIKDAVTGQPVWCDIWAGGTLAAKNVHGGQRLTFNLENNDPKNIPLRVEAQGYETWEKIVHLRVLHDREIMFQIELTPEKKQEQDDEA